MKKEDLIIEEDYLNKRISHLSSLKNDLEKSPDLFLNDCIKNLSYYDIEPKEEEE